MRSRDKLRWLVGLLVFGGLLGGISRTRADVIASWNFNDSDLGVDVGSGTLTTNFPAADISYSAGTTRNAVNGAPAGQALTLRNQANNGIGHLDMAFDASTFSGLALSFATQKTTTGFASNQVAYSTNGGTSFLNFGSPYNPPTAFDLVSFDLSTIVGLDHNPNAMLRIAFGGATSSTGNNRLDNIQILGTADVVAAPEPSSWCLACCAAGTLLWRWRKKRRADVA